MTISSDCTVFLEKLLQGFYEILSDNKKGINKLENFEIKTYKMVLASKK